METGISTMASGGHTTVWFVFVKGAKADQLEILNSWQANRSILMVGYTRFSWIVDSDGGGTVAASCWDMLLIMLPNLLRASPIACLYECLYSFSTTWDQNRRPTACLYGRSNIHILYIDLDNIHAWTMWRRRLNSVAVMISSSPQRRPTYHGPCI